MPRVARTAPSNYIYHVLTRGNNRQDIFLDDQDFRRYLAVLQKYKDRYHFKLYHYVLMTNHVHLVMEPTDKGGPLSEIMKGINLSYAQHFKAKYKHLGHFWQDRFKSILISNDTYLLSCGSYVELNPVRAMLSEAPGQYRWSSYGYYAYGWEDALVDAHEIYESLALDMIERRRKYREMVEGMIPERNAMKGEMDGRRIYGDSSFVEDMEKQYGIKEKASRRGRPKVMAEAPR